MTKRKNGFTLAEMLITLSVIGIVAALTIPGLVKNHNEKAWATAQDVFTKKLEIAMKAMNTDGTLTGYSTTASFVNALKKNIKITKVCTDDVTKCFAKEVIWNEGEEPVEVTNTAVTYDDSQGQDWAETVGVQFSNGVTALLAYNKNCTSDPFNNQFAATAACIGIVYDVQGNKKPNINGKDLVSNVNVIALGEDTGCVYTFNDANGVVCISKILGAQNGGFTYMSYADCAGENATSAESAPTDAGATAFALGISQCYVENDYWAGAVQACGGISNMLTLEQLGYLATDLYNHPSIIGPDEWLSSGSGITLDKTKAAYFLSHSYAPDSFGIWSAEEKIADCSDEPEHGSYCAERANQRVFFSNATNKNATTSARNVQYLAVCLGEQ